MTAAPDLKPMQCPSCGGSIELRAAGYSTLYVCEYCGSEISLVDDTANLIAEHAQAAGELILPLGTKGKINGVDWIVVGNITKDDGWEEWEEFLLFNPYHGYRWLIFTASGWTFGTPILSQPANPRQDRFRYEGASMRRIYDPATATIKRAIGEFYWQVKRGDEVRSTSYLGGGKVLSCELTGDEFNWTLEEYVPSREIASAFGISDTGEYPSIGEYPLPQQPNPHSDNAITATLIASIAFLCALLISIGLSFGGEERSQQFSANPASSNRTISLGTFEIDGRSRPFTIKARGEPGDNNWMYLEYTLTNTQTGEEVIASQPIEYYFGRDWKEDDRSGTVKLSAVPPGTYELTAEVSLPEDEAATGTSGVRSGGSWSGSNTSRPVAIEARSNGTFVSNLVLLFLALFAPAFFIAMRAANFASARSQGFDGSDDDDDD